MFYIEQYPADLTADPSLLSNCCLDQGLLCLAYMDLFFNVNNFDYVNL